MIIIEIRQCKKMLSAVVFEEKTVYIDNDTLFLSGYKVDDELSESQLETLKYKSEFNRARSKALWLLGRRDYSVKEMLDKLKPDFDADAAAEAVELLQESGLIDDERFAENYASDLIEFKSMSKRGVQFELVKKGIDRELASEVAERLEVDPKQAIMQIIERKYATCIGDEKGMRRLYAALARKGYGYDDIRSAIKEYTEKEI